MEITQEWVEQFIKKCADFLGKDYDTEIYSVCTNHLYDCGYRNPEYIENPINWDCYHSDWNWIMEVCIKLGMEFVITNKEQLILNIYDKLRNMETNTKL